MKMKRKTNINRVTEELNGYLTEIAAAKHWLMELDEEVECHFVAFSAGIGN